MRRMISLPVLVFVWAYLGTVPSYAIEYQSSPEWEYLLEKPSWGMMEWSSATLPKGFWYPTFEFLYLSNGSYFAAGKEVGYEGGRDSTTYMLTARLLYGLSNKLTVGVCVPAVVGQKVDAGEFGQIERAKTGARNFGDIELFLKYRIVDRYYWALAAEFGPTLPTGKPYNKAGADKAGTGDGQTDLNFNLKGDILLTEEAFVKLDTRLTYQTKREFTDAEGESIEEKLGNVFSAEAGVVQNFRNVGLNGAFRYTYWGATERNNAVELDPADIFEMSLRMSLGEASPRKHGKLDLFLDFPINGKNAPATYRFGVSIKSIFQ
ncbi:MAG: hypothetical protein JSV10_06380 [Candidatus Zixiibacteriota bacterium]|nr:MAG: hypothetical protein JSV10_06380 [candidate division Zixibacteria bacterium]